MKAALIAVAVTLGLLCTAAPANADEPWSEYVYHARITVAKSMAEHTFSENRSYCHWIVTTDKARLVTDMMADTSATVPAGLSKRKVILALYGANVRYCGSHYGITA